MSFVDEQFKNPISVVTFDGKNDIAVVFMPTVDDNRGVNGIVVHKCKKKASETGFMHGDVVSKIFKMKLDPAVSDVKTRTVEMHIEPLPKCVKIVQSKTQNGKWGRPKVLYESDDGRWVNVSHVTVSGSLTPLAKTKVVMQYVLHGKYRINHDVTEDVEIKGTAPSDFTNAMYNFFVKGD